MKMLEARQLSKSRILIAKIFAVLIISGLGIIYESMSYKRIVTCLTLLGLMVLGNIVRIIIKPNEKISLAIIIAEVVLIFMLEQNSRYYINYLFQSLYLINIIDGTLSLSIKPSIVSVAADLMLSSYKYIKLLAVNANFNTISEMVLLTVLICLIVISINFLNYYKKEKEKKEELYDKLERAKLKLEETSKLDTRLKLEKQRNSIARDIHDTLGHLMTGIIMELEVLEITVPSDGDKSLELVKKIKSDARKGLRQVRTVVEALSEFTLDDIIAMISEFSQNTGLKVDFQYDDISTDEVVFKVIYRAIQESLTNSIRHGKATWAEVKLSSSDEGITLIVSDNGTVNEDWDVGFGLKSMRERFLDLDGYVEFQADNGFIVEGFIPWRLSDD